MLEVWLNDLKNNSSAKRSLCLTDPIIDEFINELNEYKNPLETFVIAEPTTAIPPKLGVIVSYYKDGSIINRPTCIRRENNKWYISSYYTSISIYDENFSYLGRFGTYGNPNNNPNNHAAVFGFYVNETDDIIVIACYPYHCVLAYRLSDGSFLWKSGTGVSGNVSDDRLYNPYSVDRLPNGNFIVACYNGRGQDDAGNNAVGPGHITEIDATNGNIIASRIMYVRDGNTWNNAIANPTRVVVKNNRIYVASYTRQCVGVWDVDTWDYITTYTKPKGIDIGSLNIRGLYIDDTNNEIVASLDGAKCIAGVDLDTHDLKWTSGEVGWDDRSSSIDQPGIILSIYDLYKYNDNNYVVCDYGNNRVTILPKEYLITVNYNLDISNGYEIIHEYLPEGFDPETKTKVYKYSEYEQQKLLIPVRKICT